MTSDTEKRQEYRLAAQETVFIEVASSTTDSSAPASVIISNSVDISTNGMQIITDRDIAIGTIHPTCIQLDNPARRIQLVTEVKWSKKLTHSGEFLIGLALFESEDTDIQVWKEIIAERYCS